MRDGLYGYDDTWHSFSHIAALNGPLKSRGVRNRFNDFGECLFGIVDGLRAFGVSY